MSDYSVLIYGGSGSEVLFGGPLEDILYGQSGDDTLFGLGASDQLYGGFFDDIVYGGNGDDSLFGAHGEDVLYGGKDDDYIFVGDGSDVVYGGDGDDTVVRGGGTQQDTYFGGLGQDTIVGRGIGASFVIVDLENDEIRYDQDLIDELFIEYWFNFEHYDNSRSGFSYESVIGTDGANHLATGSQDNSIDGRAGNDTLLGNRGDDTLIGGAGDDQVYGGPNNDTLFGGADSDSLYGGLGDDYLFGGASSDFVYGGDGDDTVQLSEDSGDANFGGDGSDTVDARGFAFPAGSVVDLGNSEVRVGELFGGIWEGFENYDNAAATSGDELVIGTVDANFIATGSGNNSISGLSGDDTIDGGNGNDTLDGGPGIDTLSFLSLAAPGIQVNGFSFGVIVELDIQVTEQDTGQGIDRFEDFENLEGSGFNDALFGDGQANTIWGGDGRDFLSGEGGSDTLFGGAGADVLDGGNGANALFGGTTRGGTIEADMVAYFTAEGPLKFIFGTSISQLEGGTSAEIMDDVIGYDIEGMGGAARFPNTFDASNVASTTFFLGGSKSDTFFGGSGTDQLLGLTGDDVLYGRDGQDALIGEGGDDSFWTGGADGAADFIFLDGVSEGNDTVHDLELGVDVIAFIGQNVTSVSLEDSDAGGTAAKDTLLTYFVEGNATGTITIIDHDAQSVLDGANLIGVVDIYLA